jgi:mRNA interferase RelE/StbE
MYQLLILPSAAKYLKKIKDVKLKSLFKETVDKIILNPYQGERKTGNLSDLYGVDFHYNKTNYEVANLNLYYNIFPSWYTIRSMMSA